MATILIVAALAACAKSENVENFDAAALKRGDMMPVAVDSGATAENAQGCDKNCQADGQSSHGA